MYILAGKYGKKALKAPKGDQTRPTTSKLREALFNILQGEVEGTIFLDLFAGSGAIGFEALSRGAKKVIFVEKDPLAIKALHENIKALNVKESTEVYMGDVMAILLRLLKLNRKFDLIYADAPYTLQNMSKELLLWFSEHSLLNENGKLFIEDINKELAAVPPFTLVNSRRSGKAYLHQFNLNPAVRITHLP